MKYILSAISNKRTLFTRQEQVKKEESKENENPSCATKDTIKGVFVFFNLAKKNIFYEEIHIHEYTGRVQRL